MSAARFGDADRWAILGVLDCWERGVDLNYRAYLSALIPEMLDEIQRLRSQVDGAS